MTIIDEMNESEKLLKLEFVEFLEFIGRIAQQVFIKQRTMQLFDKILLTLQKMFTIINATVIVPETEYEYDIESDKEEYLY